jgi:RimJ/RimL family protein N-acetyltransferase
MNIRALHPSEEGLFQQAFAWTADSPVWFRQMDKVFPETFGDYHLRAFDTGEINYGIFSDGLVGLFTVCHCGSGVFNVHVSAKRGASVDVMLEAACMLRDHLFKTGAQVLHGWVARFNRGVIRLGEHAGFHRDGVRMFKGECRGRVIEWVHLVSTRADWEAEIKLAA